MGFEVLPEGCIAGILSRTTPADVCRLSLVSKLFRSAAESDAVWDRFLPSDVYSIVPQSNYPSKKALFLALSDHPLIIDDAKKSFQLDKKTGKKIYMLAPRALSIVWGDTSEYWNWKTLPESRFPEVAELKYVCWLEIHGTMNTFALSPNTQYAAYLVFKMINAEGFRHPVELSVEILGGHASTKNVCLDPNIEGERANRVRGLQRPNVRCSDGWLELEMGEFFNAGLEDEMRLSVIEVRGGTWKSGLVLEGIEIRPKEEN
ncbi:hypothetical protein RJT34_23296 [Clitoria ternatea]|uniref:F-box domain-containing protein n=1 Tax=Clitoria ternatea TaxID=43366 RepID=A0AAN9FLD6_CLITE